MDEPIHLAAGYTFLRTGSYKLSLEHPPLSRVLCALPLLGLQIDSKVEDATYKLRQTPAFALQWLDHNRLPPDTILFYGRLGTIFLTSLLVLSIALWTRSRFGVPAAIVAALLA